MPVHDVAVLGGGILGLAVTEALTRRHPRAQVVLCEKEDAVGLHQSGRNSGVIHSGLYYAPGSLKARLCVAGNRSMVEFCRTHDIPHDVCGKVVVAVDDDEVPALERLHERGRANGVPVTRLTPGEVAEIEPHVRCVAGLKVPTTGIVDFGQVCSVLADLVQERGVDLHLGAAVTDLVSTSRGRVVETTRGSFEARLVVNCTGLYSDRVARLDEVDPGARIVPFRGEYHELRPEARHLVNTLVYPVPDPAFPFLGVHLTKMIDGSVHAGPNAVPATAREGYRKRDFRARDVWDTVSYPGFWRLARRHAGEGVKEIRRSLSRKAFAATLRRLVPEITVDDLEPAPAGVRAQALARDGALVDDFLIVEREGAVHVCNAPSPAATSSLEIAETVVERLTDVPENRSAIA